MADQRSSRPASRHLLPPAVAGQAASTRRRRSRRRGDIVGLVEVMKTFYEVKAEAAGQGRRDSSSRTRTPVHGRTAAARDRGTARANGDPQAPHCQSRARSRSASSVRRASSGIAHGAGGAAPPTGTRSPCGMADEAVEIGPPHAGEILSQHRGDPRCRARERAPTPSIPATVSCPRTPTSPTRSRRRASSSSARTAPPSA